MSAVVRRMKNEMRSIEGSRFRNSRREAHVPGRLTGDEQDAKAIACDPHQEGSLVVGRDPVVFRERNRDAVHGAPESTRREGKLEHHLATLGHDRALFGHDLVALPQRDGNVEPAGAPTANDHADLRALAEEGHRIGFDAGQAVVADRRLADVNGVQANPFEALGGLTRNGTVGDDDHATNRIDSAAGKRKRG